MKILMFGFLPYYEKDGILFPGDHLGGGVATATFNLARSLVERGTEVKIIVPGPKNFSGEIDGIQVVLRKEFQANFTNNLKIMGTQKSPLAFKKYKKIFNNIIEKEEFDIFHTQMGANSVGPALAANEYGIPSVMTIHTHWPVCFFFELCWDEEICRECAQFKFMKCIFRKGLAYSLLSPIFLAIKNESMAMRRKAMAEADKIVTVSNYLKDTLIKFGFEDENIVPIYNIFQPQKRANQEYLPYFCCVARIAKEKGLKYALYALQKVVNRHSEAKLIIIGGGRSSEKKKLIGLTRKLGLSKNVIFTGWKQNDEVLDIISKSTAVVFPSVCPEPFPMAVLEGMGCGKPVIATNRGGVPEIIEDGNTGFLVPPHESEKLAEDMIYLLDNPNEVKRMGSNAFETVKRKCNPDIIANEHIKLYQSLIR